MKFTIVFHGPFRVATGAASDGLDAAFDPASPLPSSSLKGLMRDQAKRVLQVDPALVEEIFGSPGSPSPWWWSDAAIDFGPPGRDGAERVRTQLQIDQATFTAVDKTLRTSGELWPSGAEFEVRRRRAIPGGESARHEAVLSARARAITALGSDRRRGLGWVSVIPDTPWDDASHQLLLSCRGNHA
jgi:CRISPR/Cas system CSM-associated protein Csm3 (group 7 of RAMP superfamily)